MASKVEICNLALSNLGAKAISSITESSAEARACNTWWDVTLKTFLTDHNWSFATKEKALSLSTETNDNWEYVYIYPSDCLKIQSIVIPRGEYIPIEYEVELNASNSGRIILCDEAGVYVRYTHLITNTEVITANPLLALSLLLSCNIAPILTVSQEIKTKLYNDYLVAVRRASRNNAREGYKAEVSKSSLIKSRG